MDSESLGEEIGRRDLGLALTISEGRCTNRDSRRLDFGDDVGGVASGSGGGAGSPSDDRDAQRTRTGPWDSGPRARVSESEEDDSNGQA